MRWMAICLITLCLSTPALAQRAIGFGSGHDRTAPIDIAADSLDVDQETGFAVLRGNVLIIQDLMRLSADEVEIDYTEGDGKREITRMVAIGEVVIVSGEDAAEGNRAIYDLNSSSMELIGDVVVTQPDNVMSGENLVVNLVTGAGTMKGRVRTTFGAASQ